MEGGKSPCWALSGVWFLSDRPSSAGLGTVRPRRKAPLLGMHADFPVCPSFLLSILPWGLQQFKRGGDGLWCTDQPPRIFQNILPIELGAWELLETRPKLSPDRSWSVVHDGRSGVGSRSVQARPSERRRRLLAFAGTA